MCERRAVTNRLATKHRKATSPEKFRIPDDLLELTDCHRDQARAPRARRRPSGACCAALRSGQRSRLALPSPIRRQPIAQLS